MTLPHIHRSPTLLARSALLAIVLAASAGTAMSQDNADPRATPPRVAVLAGADASAADVAAVAGARSGADVRRATGTFEAQAQATRLAAEGYDVVIGVGASARTAVHQADAGEVGSGTRWETAAR